MLADEYLLAVATLTVAVWLAVWLARPKRPVAPAQQSTSERNSLLGARGLLIAGWAYSFIPAVVEALTGERSTIDVSAGTTLTPLAKRAETLFWLFFVALAVGVIVTKAVSARKLHVSDLTLFLLPWAATQLSSALNGERPTKAILVALVIGLACWVTQPAISVLRTLGTLTVLTAACSIVIGLEVPYGQFAERIGPDSKALIGHTLLAGPYGHPNTLGMALALGLPFALMIRRRTLRVGGIALILLALVWSSSRTSLAAAIVVLSLATIARGRPARMARWGRAAIAAVGSVVLLMPPLVSDPLAFSGRGQIWILSLNRWQQHRWLGAGADYFREVARLSNNFGPLAFHGHNLAVHVLVTDGVLGAIAWGIFLVAVSRCAHAQARQGVSAPVLFVTAFMVLACLEVVTDFRDLSQLGYASIVPFAVLLCARHSPWRRVEADAPYAAACQTSATRRTGIPVDAQ